ncbi:MAG: hypothetical protein M3490_02015 [Chloroflexota bacterium]|nr:hypothetical protein [Chloroflexia bacterium]MDQ3442373.1 hypothetical protein [Chloroflexota bacterium]
MTQQDPDRPQKIVVPGRPLRTDHIETDQEFEGLVNPRDLGSASRSCLAIIVILLVIALLLCVFLVGTLVM